MHTNVEAAVRKFVTDSFLYREGIESLDDDASLLANGLIDSTGILELVFFLETTFAVKVADEEVVPENLDSIGRITAYVCRKTAAVPAHKDECHAN